MRSEPAEISTTEGVSDDAWTSPINSIPSMSGMTMSETTKYGAAERIKRMPPCPLG